MGDLGGGRSWRWAPLPAASARRPAYRTLNWPTAISMIDPGQHPLGSDWRNGWGAGMMAISPMSGWARCKSGATRPPATLKETDP